MKRINEYLLLILTFALGTTLSFGQSSIDYLYNNYPCLMSEFGDDVKNCKAHYIFTIDVSGSMNQFEPSMVSCIQNFVQSLPDGDKVTILPFGTDVHTTIYGYSVTINPSSKEDVCREVTKLYHHPNYGPDMHDHTNIYKAIKATADAIKEDNQTYQVIVSTIGTDFQNNIPTAGGNFRTFTDEELKDLKKAWKAATQGCYIRTIGLELDEKGTGNNASLPGYVRDILKTDVFSQSTNGLEIVPISATSTTLDGWFKKMNREIMITKLKSIIDAENKAGQVSLSTSVNIDGETEAHISWNPTRLYKTMEIDSTTLQQAGFRFVNDTANYGRWMDQEKDIRLGKVKHSNWGFHYLDDSINIGVSMPTDCDNELEKLGIDKPLTGAKAETHRWVFTFFLPFWLTAILTALILLYFILAIRAFIINKKTKLNCKVNINDINTNEPYGRTISINNAIDTTIGKGGQYKPQDVDVEWTIQLRKVSHSPLLLFKTPHWEWVGTQGSVICAGASTGTLDYSDKTTVKLKCGENRHEHTEKVEIRMNSK